MSLSKLGRAFFKYLHSRHKASPLAMSRMLVDESERASILATPECLLDSWSKQLRKDHPMLDGELFWQILYSTAVLLRVDIAL